MLNPNPGVSLGSSIIGVSQGRTILCIVELSITLKINVEPVVMVISEGENSQVETFMKYVLALPSVIVIGNNIS